MSFMFSRFGTISKIEEQADGTIKVYGIASTGSRDSAGEIVAPEAMAAALPDYSRFPALREMHQPSAAGKVLEADVDGEGVTNIVAHVVDPLAITKVKTGVYAGFSIGGKVTARDTSDRSIITGLRLVEISLVDSPCNPDAILSMWKADMSIFIPSSDAVVARAKTLAKNAGTARFRDFLFEAREELVSEYMLEKGDMITAPWATAEEVAAVETGDEPAKEAAAVVEAAEPPATPVVEAEPAAVVTEEPKEAANGPGDADEDDHTGEGPVEPAAVVEEPKEAAAEGDAVVAAEAADADPAAALAAAIEKGTAAAEVPAPAVEAQAADPFADLGKAADALRSISSESPLLAKSLWHVSRLADLLASFASLQSCVSCEAASEGDGSAVPQAMADQLKAMGATLVAMAQEEVAELLSEPSGEVEIIYVGDYCEYAAEIVDLVKGNADLMEKAGKRHSKGDAKHIQDAHDSLTKLGAACDKANCAEKTADADQIAALTAENGELTQKLADAVPAVEGMVEKFTGTIDVLKGEIAELRKRFDDEPLPAKTAGPAAVARVAKDADSAGNGGGGGGAAAEAAMTDEQAQKAWDGLSEQQRGEIMLKIALQRPLLIAPRQPQRAA